MVEWIGNLPNEVVQAVLAVLEEFGSEAGDEAFARQGRDAAFGVGEGFDEVVAEAVEFGVSDGGVIGINVHPTKRRRRSL